MSAGLLRAARTRAGISQAELARRAGTTQSVIARYESGKVQPSLERLTRLIEACGLFVHIGISEDDPHDLSLIQAARSRTLEERFEQVKQMARFVDDARRAMAYARP